MGVHYGEGVGIKSAGVCVSKRAEGGSRKVEVPFFCRGCGRYSF